MSTGTYRDSYLTARWEWPTWLVAVAVYLCWIGLTWNHEAVPLPLLILAGGLTVCWHGSLQHETIHGHPTGSAPFNAALGCPPLALWIPYDRYRDSHVRHHQSDLTNPDDDPESFYVDKRRWGEMTTLSRGLYRAANTLPGRLVLGPAIVVIRFWQAEARAILSGDRQRALPWVRHALALAVLIYWLTEICHVPLWKYVTAFAYPGLSLTLLRSFAEHRYDRDPRQRTSVVEAGPLARLLYLNNNLHQQHHDAPGLAWYRLDRAPGPLRGPVYRGGYREVLRRYWRRPVIEPAHPET